MGFDIVGVVNSARPLGSKDDKFHFYAMDVVTARGDKAVCQVWENHPLYQTLVNQGEQLVNHKVRVSVLNYSATKRTLKSGEEERFIRYRIGTVEDLGVITDENALVGVVTAARPIIDPKGSYQFLAFEIVTSRGTTYSCQMWDDDPQYVAVGGAIAGYIDHKVQVTVKKQGVRERKMQDGSLQLQATFHITNVVDLGLAD